MERLDDLSLLLVNFLPLSDTSLSPAHPGMSFCGMGLFFDAYEAQAGAPRQQERVSLSQLMLLHAVARVSKECDRKGSHMPQGRDLSKKGDTRCLIFVH